MGLFQQPPLDLFPGDWSPEFRELRSESTVLKEVVADLTLENRLIFVCQGNDHANNG